MTELLTKTAKEEEGEKNVSEIVFKSGCASLANVLQNWLASDPLGAYSMPHPFFCAEDVCYTAEKKVAK